MAGDGESEDNVKRTIGIALLSALGQRAQRHLVAAAFRATLPSAHVPFMFAAR